MTDVVEMCNGGSRTVTKGWERGGDVECHDSGAGWHPGAMVDPGSGGRVENADGGGPLSLVVCSRERNEG